jgi:hypothetical protein
MVKVPTPIMSNVKPKPSYYTFPKEEELLRIYSIEYGPKFRYVKKNSRFDHQYDGQKDRGTLYAGKTLDACIVECDGEKGVIETEGRGVAEIARSRDLLLLELRGKAAMRLGCFTAISGISNRALTQRWSRFFYEDTEIFKEIDGLIYANAHNGEDAILLYERCENVLSYTTTSLSDREWELDLRQSGIDNNLKLPNTFSED